MNQCIHSLVAHRSLKQIEAGPDRAARNGRARAARSDAIEADIRFGTTGPNTGGS
ncbi:MAG: hypothetical protein JSR56_14180 [Proteobacteria bacterium]|nr:hypothetical protein [Pseudomonadota bacterium]